MGGGDRALRLNSNSWIVDFACGILGFGIQDTAQRIPNATNDWNPETKSHLQ